MMDGRRERDFRFRNVVGKHDSTKNGRKDRRKNWIFECMDDSTEGRERELWRGKL